MWTKSENSDSVKPLALEECRDRVIVRKNFELVAETEEAPEHWTYDEAQMTKEQYEVWKSQQDYEGEQALVNDQARADIDYLLMITEEA